VASTLVATKLYVPQVRKRLVARPRLSERLSHGAQSRLTVIAAPAGFGKTTLLSAWLDVPSSEQGLVAWLSLDENDRQPGLFWTNLIAALQSIVPGLGAGALTLIQSGQAPGQDVIATLLNDLSVVRSEIRLVLDDYHLVYGPDVEAGMALLLEHLAPHVHLVISSRADPALPLARLRARGVGGDGECVHRQSVHNGRRAHEDLPPTGPVRR
jgi:LuxR family maltose regulon positive regulatory protein